MRRNAGDSAITQNLRAFNKFMWHWLSPKWNFDDATYERTAPSFDNPDRVAIVIHNFRTRYGLASGDPQYGALNAKLRAYPEISVPSITIATDFALSGGRIWNAPSRGPAFPLTAAELI